MIFNLNSEKINAHVKKSREDAAKRLEQICTIRIKHGLPITDDYFALLTLTPYELAEADLLRINRPSRHIGHDIKWHLPYAQREILNHLEYQGEMLNQVITKLNQLMGERE